MGLNQHYQQLINKNNRSAKQTQFSNFLAERANGSDPYVGHSYPFGLGYVEPQKCDMGNPSPPKIAGTFNEFHSQSEKWWGGMENAWVLNV